MRILFRGRPSEPRSAGTLLARLHRLENIVRRVDKGNMENAQLKFPLNAELQHRTCTSSRESSLILRLATVP
jgi:hypothetical protein